MRIALIAPNYYPPEGGNSVTVRRIERHLKLLGCEVKVFALDLLPAEELLEGLKRFAPHLLHTFHGHRGGKAAHALGQELGLPYLVTLTGTDIYQALTDQRRSDTHLALRGASRLVAFHSSIRKRLAEHLPTLEERTVVIPQGVVLPDESLISGAHKGFLFLLPAGLRPVKNVLFPLEPLARLYQSHPEIRLQLAGPVLDTGYAAQVLEEVERYPFACYLGAVPHDEMGAHYAEADVVLNCSLFEGGMANSVLEALSYGKALLVSDIEGNRSVVKDEVDGLVYRDAADLHEKAQRLVSDPHLRQKLGRKGRALVREKHSPEQEARAYLNLYREILTSDPGAPASGAAL